MPAHAALAAQRPVALVTGAARRLGRAIALDLAQHGFDIALHYRQSHDDAVATAKALEQAGARVLLVQADLTHAEALANLVPEVVRQAGRLDAVVNNASRFEYDNATSFDGALLGDMMRSNCTPAVVLAQALALHLQSRDAVGAVVNLLDHKLPHPNPDYFSYTLSKAALASASQMLALALAPTVRVNSVSPGLTLGSALIDDHRLQALQAQAPLGVAVAPQHIAAAVRYLLQNPSVTGTNLVVDAGAHLKPAPRDVAFL